MAENKTKATEASVIDFIEKVASEKKKQDAYVVLELMKKISGEEPVLWGPSLIGFGKYHYKYESGHEGDFFLVGFSPRKTALTLYIMAGFKRYDKLMEKLGKFKTGKSCLYINKLEDIDLEVLAELIEGSLQYMRAKYPS